MTCSPRERCLGIALTEPVQGGLLSVRAAAPSDPGRSDKRTGAVR
jgi:hypothetical protein